MSDNIYLPQLGRIAFIKDEVLGERAIKTFRVEPADGGKLYVACGRSGVVSVIDTIRGVKVADIAVGKLPWGVAIR